MVSEKGLSKLGKSEGDVVEVVGRGHAVSSLFEDGEFTQLTTTALAAEKAYRDAGVEPSHPIVEVHDCFGSHRIDDVRRLWAWLN